MPSSPKIKREDMLQATLELLTELPEISSATDTQKTSAIGSSSVMLGYPFSITISNVAANMNDFWVK